VRQHALDRAAKQYTDAITAQPKFASAYVLLGMIYDAQKKYDQATAQYEKALQIDPKLGPAANNLAWNYAEYGGNLDVALSLAQQAKEQYPDNPSISDTLGWIYYKKNAYLKAISLLKESVDKVPDNPIVHYHLGMAYYKNGEKILAKKELQYALKLSQDFQGAEEAKKTLQALKD
jgi:tetratricopeptide (TPR) repeat protein